MSNLNKNASRDLFILKDETNPKNTEATQIFPKTILDQVFDQESPTHKNLRDIIKDLRKEILSGGLGNIVFPVNSVNGQTGDVILKKKHIGLSEVDNTRDIDKPLSGPQRNDIMAILKGYNFKVNLNPLYEHISNQNNPHGVTVTQINKDDQLTDFVKSMIYDHCLDENRVVHLDIRNSIAKLWNYVETTITNDFMPNLKSIREALNDHCSDPHAHADLFDKKENRSNRTNQLSKTSDHVKYPTARAVVDYVVNEFAAYDKAHPIQKGVILEIKVIPNRSDLPAPSIQHIYHAYLIRNGNSSQVEIARCRSTNNTYAWEIVPIGAYSKFNEKHFEFTPEGVSVKIAYIIDTILGTTGDLDRVTKNLLKDYYKKSEADKRFLQGIKIIKGTMDGCIRYYINNDMTTMSDDLYIPGLRNLAFLEKVSENEIRELAVHNRHILSKSINARCLDDKIIQQRHFADDAFDISLFHIPKGTLVGNLNDDRGHCQPIDIRKISNLVAAQVAPQLEYLTWTPNNPVPISDTIFGVRYTGKISVISNDPHTTVLSTDINSAKYQILSAGGWWTTDTEEGTDALIGGSNVWGNVFAHVLMKRTRLELATISTGNRVDAPFDIWVRYKLK